MKKSFVARDASGKEHTIYIRWQTVPAPSRGEPNATAVTGCSLSTARGEHVNPAGPGKYVILSDGFEDDIEVTTDDPDAPQ
jgi:hypothetical protein